MISFVAVLISLLAGLEASSLQRFTLKRRGWKNVGVVSGSDLEDAEHRFFAAWVRNVPAQATARRRLTTPPPTTPMAPYLALQRTPPQHTPYPSGVIGLFPEPGAER